MIEVLAALSASAAAGMRVALPLLVFGLLQGDNLWSIVPLLSLIPPQIIFGILTSWSLIELFASKKILGQRVLQVVQLVFSPVVGALIAIAAANTTGVSTWIIGVIGGLLALVLQLVQLGWFYRLGSLPLWMVLVQDTFSVLLVFFAVEAPRLGGLVALFLLWMAVRSSNELYRWYLQQR